MRCVSRDNVDTIRKRTRAVSQAKGKDLRLDGSTAGLEGAVVEAITEARVRAVASDVAIGAAELGVGDLNHVVDAQLL